MSRVNFSIIKHHGDPKKAIFEDVTIEKLTQLWVPEQERFVNCLDYGEHFVFEVPPHLNIQGSAYLCTCGGNAVVVPPEGPSSKFICLFHATFGVHQTSMVNKDDFRTQAAEGPIIVDREKIRREKRWN